MSEDLLARIQAAGSDEEREWVVLQFSLESLAPLVQEAVWAAAIPHWFDESFLAALLNKPDADGMELFQYLVSLSYVERFPGRGHNIHERTRALLLKQLWEDDEEHFRVLSERAAAYCARQDQSDTGWRIETIYHLLIADPDDGVAQLTAAGWEWQNAPNFAYNKVEAMAKTAREHADANRLTEREVGWTLFWEGHLDFTYARFQSAKSKMLQINIDPETDVWLMAETSFRLGRIYFCLNEYEEARQKYEEALPICRKIEYSIGEANCIIRLGDVHLALENYEEAQKRYEEALQLYRQINNRQGEANCIFCLGDFHFYLKNYEEAQKRYEEARELYQKINSQRGESNCITRLGDVHLALENYEEARRCYEQALQFYQQNIEIMGEAGCNFSLGSIHFKQENYNAARQRYERALALYQQINNQTWAATCLEQLKAVAEEQKAEQKK